MADAAAVVKQATPWGAIIGGATDIFKSLLGQDIAKKQLDLQAQEQHFQQSLQGLSNEQQYVLQSQLNAATNDTQRYSILTNAVLQIKLNQQNSSSKSSNNKTILIIAIMAIALLALIALNRK